MAIMAANMETMMMTLVIIVGSIFPPNYLIGEVGFTGFLALIGLDGCQSSHSISGGLHSASFSDSQLDWQS